MAALQIGIAGAGLLGRLLAWRLSGLGHAVTVFDPASGPLEHGHAAAWSAAGMLSPCAELEYADPEVAVLGTRSLDLWASMIDNLPQPVHFRREGSLLLAHDSDVPMAQRLIKLLAGKALPGQSPRTLTSEQLHELEPSIHGASHSWLLEGEGQIHTVQAMAALADGATQQGTKWHWGKAVQSVAPGRIDGHKFDTVFDVRGVGAPNQSVRGVRGEILWLQAPGLGLTRPIRLLHPRWRVYVVPRPGDLVVVGASEIESEDRSPISVRTLLGLLSSAHSVLPDLAEARIVHTETNLRPARPDNLPRIDSTPGLNRINGLFRHGWLIAPALVEQALCDIELDRMVKPQTQAEPT